MGSGWLALREGIPQIHTVTPGVTARIYGVRNGVSINHKYENRRKSIKVTGVERKHKQVTVKTVIRPSH